jgi:hypothetical protein
MTENVYPFLIIIYIIVVSRRPLYFPVPSIVDSIEQQAPIDREDGGGRGRERKGNFQFCVHADRSSSIAFPLAPSRWWAILIVVVIHCAHYGAQSLNEH